MRRLEGIEILEGEHTDEAPAAVGYTAEQIAELRRAGAVA